MKSKHLIEKSLCTRCGACFAVDHSKILGKDFEGYPLVEQDDAEAISKLKTVCMGANVEYRKLMSFVHGKDSPYEPSTPDVGIYKKIGIAYSADSERVTEGQSGGVSTTIMEYGMKLGLFEQCVGVRRPKRSEGKNPFSAEPYVLRSSDDINDASGSKYSPSNALEAISEVEGTFCISLLPCQTIAMRNMTLLDADFEKRCRLIIGPFCGFVMNNIMGDEFADAVGLDPLKVNSFANRGGPFPGETIFDSGVEGVTKINRTAHRALYRMYTPSRCWTCNDFGNELADITIADAWMKSSAGGYRYPKGAAWVIARTERGVEALQSLVSAGALVFEEVDPMSQLKNWEASFEYRKVRAFNRLRIDREAGEVTPDFDFPIPAPDEKTYKSDLQEKRIRNYFKNERSRKRFLKWWLKMERESIRSPLKRFVLGYLKKTVFTHENNPAGISSFIRYSLERLRLKR